LLTKKLCELSGGELQRVAIAECLLKEAELYLLDEPSAYLDANQRMIAARTIRRVMEHKGCSALVVDHDVYFIDYISDGIILFEGESGKTGNMFGPYKMRKGMNEFLKRVKSGEATTQDLKAACDWLKTNDVTGVAYEGNALDKLNKIMPKVDPELVKTRLYGKQKY